MIVIEMNPRVSQLSPCLQSDRVLIAKIAAKLAVGYTLDEIPNDITRETPASFGPPLTTSSPRFRASLSRNFNRLTPRSTLR